MKSYLATRVSDPKALGRDPYGYNLVNLWAEAGRQKGLGIPEDPPDWCVRLNELTTGPAFFARYHTGVNGLVFPVQSEMVSGIDELSAKTEASFAV